METRTFFGLTEAPCSFTREESESAIFGDVDTRLVKSVRSILLVTHQCRELTLSVQSLAHSRIDQFPLVLIGSDFPQLIVPTEPVRMGPRGGPGTRKHDYGFRPAPPDLPLH